ncbi:MAG: hypothetical protein ABW221_09165 [Vicinamibacteria bacterium]
MRGTIVRAAAAVLTTVVLAAQAHARDVAQGLRGRWNVDKHAAVEAGAPPEYHAATPEKKKEMLAEAVKGVPDMSFEFTADTISADMGSGEPQVATYRVTKVEKGTVYFDAIARTAPDQEPDKMYAEFVDDDTIRLSKVGDEVVLVLKRAQ